MDRKRHPFPLKGEIKATPATPSHIAKGDSKKTEAGGYFQTPDEKLEEQLHRLYRLRRG